MEPNDLLAAGTAVAKVAAGSIPFTAIVKRMLGPAADEVAEMWRDQVRVYRYGNQLKLLEKAEKMADEAGFTPQAIPPKILFPLLEGASFEDNEDLHTMWAALLANAAAPESGNTIRPGFIASLRQMAPDEAGLLMQIAQGHFTENLADGDELMEIYANLNGGPVECIGNPPKQMEESIKFVQRFRACRDGLLAEQLIKRSDDPPDRMKYGLSSRGIEFLRAVRPPTPKK